MIWVLVIAVYLAVGLILSPYQVASNVVRSDSLALNIAAGIVYHAFWLPLLIWFIIAVHSSRGFGGWI